MMNNDEHELLIEWLKLINGKLNHVVDKIGDLGERYKVLPTMPPVPPPSAPPDESPRADQETPVTAIDPSTIEPCVNRIVYIWLINGRGFWMWISAVERNLVIGVRWNGIEWVPARINVNRIESFLCF